MFITVREITTLPLLYMKQQINMNLETNQKEEQARKDKE
jgi:hypothetical protein